MEVLGQYSQPAYSQQPLNRTAEPIWTIFSGVDPYRRSSDYDHAIQYLAPSQIPQATQHARVAPCLVYPQPEHYFYPSSVAAAPQSGAPNFVISEFNQSSAVFPGSAPLNSHWNDLQPAENLEQAPAPQNTGVSVVEKLSPKSSSDSGVSGSGGGGGGTTTGV